MMMSDKSTWEEAFGFAEYQLRKLVENHPDAFPMYTQHGQWALGGETWTNWCEGFLGGQLWLLYQQTGNSYWREKAMHYSQLIEPRKLDCSVHDLGFLFWPTWKRWYDLDGDPMQNDVVVQAGRTLALRFQEKGGYLCSFLAKNSLFIDIMMNVGIIFYAAEQSNDPTLQQIAFQHCLTTRSYLVRGDGSTAHEGLFDTQTGEFLHQSTQQGWRGDSCWARGQAWAIYGFSIAYSYTHDLRFLQTAQSCADFYIQHTPPHGIPPNDWDEPSPTLPFESSAAAIAARGLLFLAKQVGSESQAPYQSAALQILESLCTPEFLAASTPGWEGVIKHGIYHQRKKLGVDESVMWGDYFFLGALYEVLHA